MVRTLIWLCPRFSEAVFYTKKDYYKVYRKELNKTIFTKRFTIHLKIKKKMKRKYVK